MFGDAIISYLIDDSTLAGLLGDADFSGDTKIYPIKSPESASKGHIVFNFPSIGGIDELIDEAQMYLRITTDSYSDSVEIMERLKYLLDKESAIQNISDDEYYIYYVKQSSGGGDYRDVDTGDYVKVLIYDIKYRKK
ncbi:hypothetical protein KKE60_08105 [Patescibacteria group bacterium]|nr:hypothetical protein [Patescibacteria group bacterium]